MKRMDFKINTDLIDEKNVFDDPNFNHLDSTAYQWLYAIIS